MNFKFVIIIFINTICSQLFFLNITKMNYDLPNCPGTDDIEVHFINYNY